MWDEVLLFLVPFQNFSRVLCTQVSDSGPFGLLFIELAAPYTLANNNEMNSDDRLPFIIFLTPISCNGSNRLWHPHLLPSPCSLSRHKQMLVGVIRPLAGRKCRRFHWATERYRFHWYLCIFCVLFILFCTNRVTLSYQNCIHSNSTLKHVTAVWETSIKIVCINENNPCCLPSQCDLHRWQTERGLRPDSQGAEESKRGGVHGTGRGRQGQDSHLSGRHGRHVWNVLSCRRKVGL